MQYNKLHIALKSYLEYVLQWYVRKRIGKVNKL